MSSIAVKDLRKYYGEVKAVDGVSFRVEPGEIYGLLGPNGAGKTTTIEILVGLRNRDGGHVEVLGRDPQRDHAHVKGHIGVQLQAPSVYPLLTVAEVVDLFASFYSNPLAPSEAIAMVGLTEKRKTRTRNLSGGQMHRLAIALAIVGNGEIIFLDEPTTGLDPQARRNLWDIILELRRRSKAVLLTTHYMDEAERLCDYVAIIDHGHIIEEGPPREMVDRHFVERAMEFRHPLLTGDARLETLRGVRRVVADEDLITIYTGEVTDTMSALLELGREVGSPIDDVIVRRATLEDLFLKLTGRRMRE